MQGTARATRWKYPWLQVNVKGLEIGGANRLFVLSFLPRLYPFFVRFVRFGLSFLYFAWYSQIFSSVLLVWLQASAVTVDGDVSRNLDGPNGDCPAGGMKPSQGALHPCEVK
jgi:hypothetical protein